MEIQIAFLCLQSDVGEKMRSEQSVDEEGVSQRKLLYGVKVDEGSGQQSLEEQLKSAKWRLEVY
jgi:hypothetical protein